MKWIRNLSSAAVLSTLASVAVAGTQVNAGISVSDDGVKGFYLAIGQAYNVPEREVIAVHERRIPDDEIPVVYFIARQARVQPNVVIEFRLGGHSWFEVSRHFGLGPDVYYVECREVPKGPYGRAIGYYRNRPRSEWKQIRLADDDIVNLVNVRFAADRYHYRPEEVIRLRENNHSYVVVNREAQRGRHHDSERNVERKAEKKKVVIVEGSSKDKRGHGHRDD